MTEIRRSTELTAILGAADADLIAGGVLVEFKSARNIHAFDLVTVRQLLGCTLMDCSDVHRIDPAPSRLAHFA
ncbi:hypothetical protein [Streptosporangium sp. V21-05]|uniref:hypothetical protein n=1 Tax=Streptosporangium sp. V21-05 TaxID=3446115 RepID=UPI003F53D958